MKLSLAWIFDHIDADWKVQNVDDIIARFNNVTAEIEGSYKVSYDVTHFFLGTVAHIADQEIELFVPELSKNISMFPRTDITVHASGTYMIKKESERFVWVTRRNCGLEKDGLLPAFFATEEQLKGSWRNEFESEDIILEVDNKSITHRPDMWGHRGFAREIAAFMNLPFIAKEKFLKNIPVSICTNQSSATVEMPIALHNKALQACTRFTALYFSSIVNQPSSLRMASRLLKVDATPYNAIVDLTNYVMLDWSQPMHAYDASTLANQQIIIRMAQEKEHITLLSGDKIELTSHDLVIADANKPQCLAGVKGGFDSSMTESTTSVLLEAACFDAGDVRRTAQRHKIRTDSSARFEKTLDPNQTTEAIRRFVYLLNELNISSSHADSIISLGAEAQPLVIEIEHEFLEQRSGVKFSEHTIVALLTALEFGVEVHKSVYSIAVPSFRASKDIKIKEDILEEVVRCYGFDKIPLDMPRILRTPFNFQPITRLNAIKHFFAYSAHMIEQQNYSLFDEHHLVQLGLHPDIAVSLVNPVSENHYRMITSLIPGLLKNIQDNHVGRESLSFFECGRVWQNRDGKPHESKSIAGIYFKKRTDVDFYQSKFMLTSFFKTLGFVPTLILWDKMDHGAQPWYQAHQSATLIYNDKSIGYAGKLDSVFMNKLDLDAESDAFIFELNGDFILTEQQSIVRYQPISKFQETTFDLSLFVPLALETVALERGIAAISGLIKRVELVDFFQKDGSDTRALTFRVWLVHDDKTLEKSEIDEVWQQAVAAVQLQGAMVRM